MGADQLVVHHEHLSLDEKILRHFDLSSQYGVRSPLLWPLTSMGDPS